MNPKKKQKRSQIGKREKKQREEKSRIQANSRYADVFVWMSERERERKNCMYAQVGWLVGMRLGWQIHNNTNGKWFITALAVAAGFFCFLFFWFFFFILNFAESTKFVVHAFLTIYVHRFFSSLSIFSIPPIYFFILSVNFFSVLHFFVVTLIPRFGKNVLLNLTMEVKRTRENIFNRISLLCVLAFFISVNYRACAINTLGLKKKFPPLCSFEPIRKKLAEKPRNEDNDSVKEERMQRWNVVSTWIYLFMDVMFRLIEIGNFTWPSFVSLMVLTAWKCEYPCTAVNRISIIEFKFGSDANASFRDNGEKWKFQ